MARNRKKQTAAVRFGPALRACLLCFFIGGSGVGYVWQKEQIYELGRQIKMREVRLENLKRQKDSHGRVLAQLQSTTDLDGRVTRMNLGLAPAQPDQVVRLTEPVAETQPGQGPRMMAGEADRALVIR